MDQNEFDLLMQNVPKAPEGAPVADPAAANPPAPAQGSGAQPATDPSSLDAAGRRPDGTLYSEPPAQEPGLGEAGVTSPLSLDAITGGGLKAVFETKDFLFGEPIEKSDFRKNVEGRVDQLSKDSTLDSLTAGVSQFAVAMVGLGKLTKAAEVIPWFGKAVALAPKTTSSVQAAIAGAVAFDPQAENLANLAEGTPLIGPLLGMLGTDPNDSNAENRLKNAVLSIGIDATVGTVLMGAAKVYRALHRGDAKLASKLVDDMQAEKEAAIKAEGQDTFGVDTRAGGPAEPTAPPPTAAGATPDVSIQPAPLPEGPAGGSPNEAPIAGAGAADGAHGAAGAEQPVVTSTPTAAAAAQGVELPGSPKPTIKLADEDTAKLLIDMNSDANAVSQFGSWSKAFDAGHVFGNANGIPWEKLNTEGEVSAFAARLFDAAEEGISKVKGGAVLPDAKVSQMVARFGNLFNTDPASVLGIINAAGKDASKMAVSMETAYVLSNKMLMDTYALAAKIRLGAFMTVAEKEAAKEELKKIASIAASTYASARSMTAAAGRSVRRMRPEFKVDPALASNLKTMDADSLVKLLSDTAGDPKQVAKLLAPGLLGKGAKGIEFLLVNNLVSGWKTQVVNLTTNSYMLAARPIERIIGGSYGVLRGREGAGRVVREATKQYVYMGNAFYEGFGSAVRAFLQNDSVMAPHASTEAFAVGSVMDASLQWKPMTSVGGVLNNAIKVASLPLGLPTRSLGAVDELVKQTVYRSKVSAGAHVAAMEEAAAQGLKGDAYKAYVKTRVKTAVENAFDDVGRAVDPEAMREAFIATFQQDLLPGSIGKYLQMGVQQHLAMRFMFPFIKTPTNVIRYGWKMTPGLNLLQSEYRDMLKGKMGVEAQAQAVGQMAMGSLFMGSSAYLLSQGTITGGGPSDYKAKAALRATGWQEYSVVHVNEDGTKTYIPYGRFDPIAIPFGIMADLMDAFHGLGEEETPEFSAAVGALGIALAKQFTSKTYLQGASQMLDAMMSPDDKKAEGFAGQTLSNLIPFSSALRQMNPDPYLREARSITDKLMATIPGLSDNLPARYDWVGNPIVTRKGLWSNDTTQLVDRETQRLILENGRALSPPNPVNSGIDLRELTLSDGSNAYEKYQQLAGHPPHGPSLEDMIAKRMASKAYQLAPDGEVGVKGTKLWMLSPITEAFRSRAMKQLKRDPVVRDAFRSAELKARAAYLANKKASEPPKKVTPLQAVGDAFGVDLGDIK